MATGYNAIVDNNFKLMISRREGGMLLQLERASIGRVGVDGMAHIMLPFHYDLLTGRIKVFGVKGSVDYLDRVGYAENGFRIDYHIGSGEKKITGFMHDNFPPNVKKIIDTCVMAFNGSRNSRFA